MAWIGERALRFRISQRLWVLQEFAAQSEFLRRAHRRVYKVYTMMTTAREHTLVIFGAVSLLLSVEAAQTGWKKGTVSVERGAPLQDGAMWTGQDVWCSTSSPSAHIAALSSGCLQTWMLHCCWGTASQSGVETAHQGRIWGGEQTQRCSAVLSELQTHTWGSASTFSWAAGFRSLMGSGTWRKTDFSPLCIFCHL